MKTPTLHISIITTAILLGLAMIPCASYSQAPNPPAPEPPNAGVQQALSAANITDIFTATRNGEAVNITIKIDFTPCDYVRIIRNTTGTASKRTMVGRLAPGLASYVDVLPDAKPYWYWLQVVPRKGNAVSFGPIRVAPDTNKTGNYSDISTIYKWTLTRTHQQAAIKWNFPGEGLQFVEILRKTNISNYGNRNMVVKTLEAAGEALDALPEADADYWYWIAATLSSGRVITQGPIKAEYAEE